MSEIVEGTTPVVEKYKRKRKKSFLKNARKYGKKGCYGRGAQLDADTYQYFIRIMEVFKEGFDTEEDKSLCEILLLCSLIIRFRCICQ